MSMRWTSIFILGYFVCIPGALSQDGAPAIKAEVMSAFVWGEDSPFGALSSTIQDPLTGNTVHRLSYSGVEVSSRIGFEGLCTDEIGTFLNYTSTIANGTDSTLVVRYGGISVDGHVASPLRVLPAGKKLSAKERKNAPEAVELGKIHCLTSGFLPTENFFSADTSSRVLSVAPRTALTVSSIIRDPRHYHSVRCSIEGCHPTGIIRYYLRVDDKDFVFAWPGRSAIYCGK